MATVRFLGLAETLNRKPVEFKAPFKKSSEYYGSNVFNDKAMREFLTKEAYVAVRDQR